MTKVINSIFNNVVHKILFVILVGFILSSFYITFKNDDDISIGLIMHSYSSIINIDSMDVHPPLYYLTLKLFLQVTTFWTSSIIIKIIMARILSSLFLLGSVFIGISILKEFNLKINLKLQLLIYLLVPGMVNKLVKIRMYSISSFFLFFELYELIKFVRTNKNKYIIFTTINAILASYCLYSSALSAGLFLLIVYIYKLIYDRKKSWQIFISGIILVISYIPWIPVVLSQFNYHSKNNVINNVNNLGYLKTFLQSFTQLIFPNSLNSYINIIGLFISFIILFISFYVIILLLKKSHNQFKYLFILVLLNWALTITIMLIIGGKNYEPGNIYPIFSIIAFMFVYYFIHLIDFSGYFNKFLILIIILMYSLYGLGGAYYNVKQFDIPSIALMKNYNKWTNSRDRIIHLKTNNALEALQDSLYIKSLNKKVYIKGINRKELSVDAFDIKEYKPVNVLFNNIIIR